jgi:hypothetical protein
MDYDDYDMEWCDIHRCHVSTCQDEHENNILDTVDLDFAESFERELYTEGD